MAGFFAWGLLAEGDPGFKGFATVALRSLQDPNTTGTCKEIWELAAYLTIGDPNRTYSLEEIVTKSCSEENPIQIRLLGEFIEEDRARRSEKTSHIEGHPGHRD